MRSLDSVVFGEIKPDHRYVGPLFQGSYRWLEQQVGFYPLYVAVCEDRKGSRANVMYDKYPDDRQIWETILRYDVLFSFENVEGVFSDEVVWNTVITDLQNGDPISDYHRRCLFKPSWSKARWLRVAKKGDHWVQLVTPSLYLPDAQQIWVKNHETKEALEALGFKDVALRQQS